jgi:hypothetical protein
MIDNSNKNSLKGQYNLAQGKRRRSVALGFSTGKRIVRALKIKKEKILLSDERDHLRFSGNDLVQFRPKEIICFVNCILTDGFRCASFTQGGVSVRSSRNFALGYFIFALQAGKIFCP